MSETEVPSDRIQDGPGSGLDADTTDGVEGDDYSTDTERQNHENDSTNPHSVTASQAGAVENLGSAPEILAGTRANRPSPGAGKTGRLYIETDTQKIFRDTGAEWIELAGGADVVTVSGSFTTSDEERLLVDTDFGTATLTLASADTLDGNQIAIKDKSGNANTNNITINTEGGSETIDGAASIVLDADHESVVLLSDGSNWFVVSRYSGAAL